MLSAGYRAVVDVIDAYKLRKRLLRYSMFRGRSREMSQQSTPIRVARRCSLWGTVQTI